MRSDVFTLVIATALSLSACDQRHQDDQPKTATQALPNDAALANIENIEADVRLSAASNQIQDLQRRVGMLEATPEKIDLELLNQRVQALEAKLATSAPTQKQADQLVSPRSRASAGSSVKPASEEEVRDYIRAGWPAEKSGKKAQVDPPRR